MPKIFPRYREQHMSVTVVKMAERLAKINAELTFALTEILRDTSDDNTRQYVRQALDNLGALPTNWQEPKNLPESQ